ncbi:MAG TPA: Gmad2 immunoglobulin-like domain-containing protein [Candidatus Paceibacterota bacterium]
MKKNIIYVLTACALLVLFLFGMYSIFLNGFFTPPKHPITYTNATADNIKVTFPIPDAVVGKEFLVTGSARGTWFFEASFPVEVLDKDGKVLVATPAQAEGEWMTPDFVPFKADIKIPDSYTGPATLVLNRDNPSDLPQNAASISFPITIK